MYEDYLQQSPDYPHVTLRDRIESFAIARHFVYQNFWTDQMAHADFRPLPEDMPISYGMCVTASCTLHDELTKHFRDEQFILHSGRVRERIWGKEKVIIPSHVWITQVGGYLDEHTIIDITADQSLCLPPVVVATADNLAGHGFLYQS